MSEKGTVSGIINPEDNPRLAYTMLAAAHRELQQEHWDTLMELQRYREFVAKICGLQYTSEYLHLDLKTAFEEFFASTGDKGARDAVGLQAVDQRWLEMANRNQALLLRARTAEAKLADLTKAFRRVIENLVEE